MLKNYITSALRYLLKNKGYTLLNILGLSIGLACFTMIGLWVQHELSYDQFHSKADRIYRITGVFLDGTERSPQAVTPIPLHRALLNDYPEVEEAVIIENNDAIIKQGDKQFLEDYLLMANPAFLNVFDYQLISGDKTTALNEPYSIILSENLAKKYFGDENPIGKTILAYLYDPDGKGATYTVTGVIKNCPINSHIKYKALLSYSTLESRMSATMLNEWYNNGYYTYVQLREGADAKELESKFPAMLQKYLGDEMKQSGLGYEYFIMPMTDIYLHSTTPYELRSMSSINNVIIFGTIGLIVLALACINYVNMATAFASKRLRDVGMRKVMGAQRTQLIGQYLSEACVLTFFSLLLAFVWIELSRPLFESLTGKPILNLYATTTMLTLIGIAMVTGIASGLYPSIMLSSLRPASILKGQLKSGTMGVIMRKSLVVAQFSITILLVIGIFVVQNQLSFIQNQDLGFNDEGLLMMRVNGSNEVYQNFEGFKNASLQLQGVKGMARTNTSLSGGLNNSPATIKNARGDESNITVYKVRTDFEYLDVYQMNLLAGRFFVKDNRADSSRGFIINETLAKSYGYNNLEDVIGQKFHFQGRDGEIIGIVKDFHYNSLQYSIEPACLYLLRGGYSQIAVRLEGDIPKLREQMAQLWQQYFPNTIVDANMAEDGVQDQYLQEQRFSKIFMIFSSISLAIACMGLFALVSFTVENRTKEIGIRKVLGATVSSILSMLSKEFLVLVTISTTIALPISYYFTNQWLSSFAYRFEPGFIIFIGASVLVILIAGITISTRSIKAAFQNPVDSLKSE